MFQFFSGFGMMIHVESKYLTDMNFGEILFILPSQIRSVIRRMESVWRKIIKSEAAVCFKYIYTNIIKESMFVCSFV